MYVPLTMFVGPQGNAFKRVRLAFKAYGFTEPEPDHITGGDSTGAYVSNITRQYVADLSEGEAVAVIEFGLTHGVGDLEYYAQNPASLLYATTQELKHNYQDRMDRLGTKRM